MAELRVDAAAAAALARPGAAIARAEGFETHATSMEARIRENGAR
jgi:histidinol dehydrogenase